MWMDGCLRMEAVTRFGLIVGAFFFQSGEPSNRDERTQPSDHNRPPGDNKTTAEAICRNIGVLEEGAPVEGRSFTGREFSGECG
jgi:hypothetical protein